MKVTALEVRSHQLKRSMRGYDVREVDALKELAATALEEAAGEISRLQEKLKDATERLEDHIANERMLREAITTAQKMSEDLKDGAKKEAELMIAEARMRADEIVRQAQGRATQVQEEIYRLKKQRIEVETAIKAIIDYHSATLLLEEEESRKADAEADKIKFLK